MDGRYVGGDFVFVSPEKFERDLSRNIARAGDVVFTQRGTLGQVALVPDDGYETYVVSQSQMRLRVDADRACAEFVYYAATTPQFLRQINDRAISTGVPHTNLGILAELEVPSLPLPDQQAIAEVLGALDDKIAANTRLAATADEFVRALVALSDCTDSIPLSKLFTSPRIGVDPTQIEPTTPYVGLEHVPRRSMWLSEAGIAQDASSTKSAFEAGDLLFGKLRPYFHKVVTAPFSGICSTDILVLRPRDADLSGFASAAAASDAVIASVTASSEGTRMPRASWRDLAAVDVPWPGHSAATRISEEIASIRDTVHAGLAENRTLAATRDALLPKLVSGALRVKDTQSMIEEVPR